jgi:hypothetical protein
MALTTIPSAPLMRLSQFPYLAHATVTFNNATATNNTFAAICMLQPGETVSSVYIVGGGAPVGTPTYNVSIEGVVNSGAGYGGRPDGTPLTSNGGGSTPMIVESNAGSAVTNGAVVSHDFADTYTNNTASPQFIAITIRTGTAGSGLNATNTITIRAGYQTWLTNFVHPHYSSLVSGSWSHTGSMPTLWASDNSGAVISNTSNVPLLTNETNWNSASNPNRRGIRWNAQFGCRLKSVNIMYRPAANATHEIVVNVYANDGTTLKTTSTTSYNTYSLPSSNPGQILVNVDVPPTTIAAGDVVRIFLKPDATANSALQFYCLEWTLSSQRNAFFGTIGTDVFMYTASADGTSWTDTNTKCAAIIPIIDQIDTSGGRSLRGRAAPIEKDADMGTHVERLSRYLPGAGQVTTAYALTVPADGQFDSLAAITAVNANLRVVPLGRVGDTATASPARGVRIVPFGRGADNDTFITRVYAVHCTSEAGFNGPCEVHLLATLTVTLGNATGDGASGSTLFGSSDRLADTVSVSKDSYLTAIESAFGLSSGAVVYSPANNTQASVWFPDLGNADGILFDTDLGSGSGANFLIQKDT